MQDNQTTNTKLSLDAIKLAIENGDLKPEDVMALCQPERAETDIEFTDDNEEGKPTSSNEEKPVATDEKVADANELPKDEEKEATVDTSREVVTSLTERMDKMQETLDRLSGVLEKNTQRTDEDSETQTKIDELKVRKYETMLENAPEKVISEEGQPADNFRSLDSSNPTLTEEQIKQQESQRRLNQYRSSRGINI